MKLNKQFLLLIISLFYTISTFAQADREAALKKFISAMNLVNYAYVDSVNNNELVEKAIKSMLKELDPHSKYFTKEGIKAANEPLLGKFEGVGIQFNIHHDTILVVTPIAGGPSDKAGIYAGDKIVTIDGEDATGEKLDNEFVRDRLRGKKGTKVVVGIVRGSNKEVVDHTIIRDKIPLHSVIAGYMIDDETAVIKVSRFSANTVDEFKDYIKKVREKGMKNLILDLRGNPGGYLRTAIRLADEFLSENKLVVFTEGKTSKKREYKTSVKGSYEEGKLIVLINEGSASASEIVSGAMQDYGRGLIVGRRSFGKGLVQRPFNLPDSSVIRLTTARYYTPSGRCIQRPYDEGVEEYYKDIRNRLKNEDQFYADSISFPDSLKYTTANGRTVYGGGGITPDVFIPEDSTAINDYYISILKKQVINNFVLDYLEKHRAEMIKKYPDTDVFVQNYQLDDAILSDMVKYATEKEVEYNEELYQASKERLSVLLKATLARNLYNIAAYYEVISQIDNTLIKAAKMMKDNKVFTDHKIKL